MKLNDSKFLVGCFTMTISVLLLLFVIPIAIQACWNFVMPAIFSLPTITYAQSVCLYMLVSFLFSFNIHKH